MKRRGIYVHQNQRSSPVDEEQAEVSKKRTHFPSQKKSLPEPVGKSLPKLAIIEKYKELGQGLDILYRAPG